MAAKATGMSVRVAAMTRENTSRPVASVPNQWAPLGGSRIKPGKVFSGSYGMIHGAMIVMISTALTITRPKIPAGRLRTNRR